MNEKTRATLLNRLRDGADALAWDEFFDRYWPLIYSFARYRGCSDHTAEEVVQDVMLKVFQQRDVFQYDPTRGRFRDWLGTVVRNQVAEFRRRPSDRVRGQGGNGDTTPPEPGKQHNDPQSAWEAAFERSLLVILLDVVRREMNPRTYLAFELFVLEDLPVAEVAQSTGVTRSAVYKTRRRVFKRLRELAGTYNDDGQLCESIRQALESLPDPKVERSLTARVAQSMQSRQEDPRSER